jgi:GntR family transcriptional regulator
MTAVAIDRGSPIPFYFQLAQALRGRIDAGAWAAGARLPSEAELCDTFAVSRSVVRQALGMLEAEGIIRKLKGRGAFVAEVATERSWLLQSSDGFFQDEVARRGAHVTSQILRAERGTLPRWAGEALEAERAGGATLERLRWVDGELALYVVNHVPAPLADVALALRDDESLYARLGAAGVRGAGGRRTVAAVAAEPPLDKLLGVRRGAPLMFIESVSWTAERRPFDCYRAWVRTDRMRIEIQVTSSERTA